MTPAKKIDSKTYVRTLIHKTLRLFSAVVIICTFLAYLCPQVNPSVFPYLVHFGTAFAYLFVLNLVLGFFWFWNKKSMAIYHLLILLVGYPFVLSFVGINLSASEAPDRSLLVATHNIGGLASPYKVNRKERDSLYLGYTHYLKENGTPDIFCLQESRKRDRNQLADHLGYTHVFNLKHGTAIFSKYPIKAGGEVVFENTDNSSIWVDVKISGKTLRIYNIHLQSNKVSDDTEKVVEEGKLDERKTWNEIGSVLKKVGRSTGKRALQAQLIRDHMDDCPYPIILCGDFNDTPNSYVYNILSAPLCDAFREKGFGFGSSLARFIPLLRIDYILSEPSLPVYSCTIFKKALSDHYLIYARIGY